MEDLKAKLAVQEVELWQRNTDIEALIAKIGQQTDKLNQERAVADAEEQRVRVCVVPGFLKQQQNRHDILNHHSLLHILSFISCQLFST